MTDQTRRIEPTSTETLPVVAIDDGVEEPIPFEIVEDEAPL